MKIYVVHYDSGKSEYFAKQQEAKRELWLTYMDLFGKMEDPALQELTEKELNKSSLISSVGRIEAAWLNM